MLAVIGGSGFYSLENLKILDRVHVETPFGFPSSPVIMGELQNKKIAFLPRHGSSHQFLPSEINFKANIFALKSLGARSIISFSAVGSLCEEVAPGDFALVSQYIDHTKNRSSSFFGNGMAAHMSSAKPSCEILAQSIYQAAEMAGIPVHKNKTYVCVEGPRLGTQAESRMFRSWGADLVGMTNTPEAFLAKEAQMAYCSLAICTDYDCWKDDPSEFVSLELVLKRFGKSIVQAKQILEKLVNMDLNFEESDFRKAIINSVMTSEEAISPKNKEILNILRI